VQQGLKKIFGNQSGNI